MSLRFDRVMNEREALQLNALQLAYIGDSVWETIIRFELVIQKLNVKHMHEKCVSLVNARSQARILYSIQKELSECEREIVQRGRNAHARHPVPRNQNAEDYAMATGFEALLGFLYLTGQNERIKVLIYGMKEGIQNGRTEKAECDTAAPYDRA